MDFFTDCPRGIPELLSNKVIGIAGAGGIGSNVAMLLVRSGARKIAAADFDTVEPSNLNRQFYFSDQIGRPKTEALAENLKRINPDISFTGIRKRISPENIETLLGECDLLFEAVDLAETKGMIVEKWLSAYPERPIIACSGIAGAEGFGEIVVVRSGRLSVVGDQRSELELGTLAAKVTAVASAMVMEMVRRFSGGKCAECGECQPDGLVLKSNGRKVPLSGFPARMVEDVVRGMLGNLKGADPQGSVTIEIGHARS